MWSLYPEKTQYFYFLKNFFFKGRYILISFFLRYLSWKFPNVWLEYFSLICFILHFLAQWFLFVSPDVPLFVFLTDTKVDPSLHDRQRQLKRARLADGLNDKLSHRPGPLELVQGNILQTNEELAEAIKGEAHIVLHKL